MLHATWDPSMLQNCFLNSSPDPCLDSILFLSSTGSLFDLKAWILLWYAFSAVRSFIKTCVPFQIIPIQLNLPQFNSTQSVVTSTSDMNAPELNFNCPRKVLNTYAMESFKFFIFNKFAKMLLFNFFALSLWCMECRLMWKKIIYNSLT